MSRFALLLACLTPLVGVAAPIILPKETGPKPRIVAPSEYTQRLNLQIGDVRYSTFLTQELLLVVGSEKSTIIDTKSGKRTEGPKVSKALSGATFKNLIVIGSATGFVVFKNKDGALTELAKKDSKTPVTVVNFHPTGDKIVYRSGEKELTLWKLADQSVESTHELETIPLAVAFAGNGRHLAIVGRDGWLRYRAQFTGGKEHQYWMRRVQRADHNTVAFSPDSRYVATASAGRVAVFDALNGRQMAGLERRFGEGEVRSLQFSNDGTTFACIFSGESAVVRVWQTETWSEIAEYGLFAKGGECFSFSPDLRVLAAIAQDGETFVWPFRPAEKIEQKLTVAEAWEKLDNDDLKLAQAAYRKLLSSGDDGVNVVIKGLANIEKEIDEMKKWVKNLDDPSFKIRQRAVQELGQKGTRAAWLIYAIDTTKLDTESANSIRLLKSHFEDQGFTPNESGLYGDALRRARATQILERSKSANALKSLEILASGDDLGYATREAKLILASLKQK